MVNIGIAIGVAFLALLFLVLLFKSFYRTPRANEALIITGFGVKRDGFKIVTGTGALVWPVFQSVGRLSLSAEQTNIYVEGVDAQKIPIGVNGSVVFKVGHDDASITNAARRFMGDQGERGADLSQMHQLVQNVIHGHLRSIMGGLTVEDLIANRNALAQQARDSVREEFGAMGLVVDSLQIQDIKDPSGYILSLGQPREAEVKMNARIAQANRDREATEREQEADALKAAARKESEVKRANYQSEIDRQLAVTAQAGPLADAEARKAVVQRETEIAALEQEREQARLITTVQRPAEAQAQAIQIQADASKYQMIAAAEASAREAELAGTARANVSKQTGAANADVTRLNGSAEAESIAARGKAEGEAVRAKGLAEAEAIAKRAEALEKESEAVIGQTLAESLPAVVAAAAGAFANVQNMTVLNGAEGVMESLSQIVAQGGSLLSVARQSMANGKGHTNGNGTLSTASETLTEEH